MKLIVTALFALAMLSASAQADPKQALEKVKQETAKLDSTSQNVEAAINNVNARLDSLRNEEIKKQAERSGAMMLKWHKERQAEQRKKMFMYFGMAAFFLVVLVVGLRRKGKRGSKI